MIKAIEGEDAKYPINFFPGANTRYGFHSKFAQIDSNLAQKVYILKGGPGVGKSTFIRRISDHLTAAGYTGEYYWCSSDSVSLDGVYFGDIGIKIIDGTNPHMIDPELPGIRDETLNLLKVPNARQLKKHRSEIAKLSDLKKYYFSLAYGYLAAAGSFADTIENTIRSEYKISEVICTHETREIVDKITQSHRERTNPKYTPNDRNMFISGICPQGIISNAHELVESSRTIYLVRDKWKLFAQSLLDIIQQIALINDFSCWKFFSPLDPGKLQHLYLPQIRLAVLTVRNGNKLSIPEEKRETVIKLDTPLTSEIDEIVSSLSTKITDEIEEARKSLKIARNYHKELEKYYTASVDFSAVNKVAEKVIDKLF